MSEKIQYPYPIPPCRKLLNAEVLMIDNGSCKVRFVPTKEMENPFGVVLGGLLDAMLDMAIGPATVSVADGRSFATVQMSVNYFAAAKAGEALIGLAEVVKAGRTQAYCEAVLERESDKTAVARATAVNLFLERR